jgi:hypothetical protein
MLSHSLFIAGLPSTGTSLKAGGSKQPAAEAAGATGGGGPDSDADLEARLENLRRQ